MSQIELNASEWDQAMNLVLAMDTEEPAVDEKAVKSRILVVAGLNYSPNGEDSWSAKQPVDKGKISTSTEIPPSGPGDSGVTSPADKPDKIGPDKFATRVGKPESKNKSYDEIPPSGPGDSSAVKPKTLQSLEEDDTSKGWSAKTGKPSGTEYVNQSGSQGTKIWTAFPSGGNGGMPTGRPDGKTTVDTLDRAPRASMADEDLDNDVPDNLSLPDGSFFIAQPGDIAAAVDKVKNAEQANPRPDTHPWYAEIKKHIARRAHQMGFPHMVPDDWHMMMAAAIEQEWARDYDAAERKELAKRGWALPDGSYPIRDKEDLENAMILARSGHGDVQAAKALIRRRAKDMGVHLPDGF